MEDDAPSLLHCSRSGQQPQPNPVQPSLSSRSQYLNRPYFSQSESKGKAATFQPVGLAFVQSPLVRQSTQQGIRYSAVDGWLAGWMAVDHGRPRNVIMQILGHNQLLLLPILSNMEMIAWTGIPMSTVTNRSDDDDQPISQLYSRTTGAAAAVASGQWQTPRHSVP